MKSRLRFSTQAARFLIQRHGEKTGCYYVVFSPVFRGQAYLIFLSKELSAFPEERIYQSNVLKNEKVWITLYMLYI
jgi:hypothetical protein